MRHHIRLFVIDGGMRVAVVMVLVKIAFVRVQGEMNRDTESPAQEDEYQGERFHVALLLPIFPAVSSKRRVFDPGIKEA